jgi:membrane-bound lytic murein transglycosylase D
MIQNKKTIIVIIFLVFGIFLLSATIENTTLFSSFRNNLSADNTTQGLLQNAKAPQLPIKFSFCDEIVPVTDMEVRERLDREIIVNCFRHSNTILMIKRAARWLPVIEPILKSYGIPDDMKYLCMAESEFLQDVSPAGASGFWQIMKSTANMYGLTTNAEVDERYNVEKSTKVACKYLLDAKQSLGSWTLSAASYNMGIAGVNNSIAKQGENNYYNLLLNNETTRYVFRILAMKAIFENQKQYGFFLNEEDKYLPYEYTEKTIDGSVASWVTYAKNNGTNYRTLRVFNPWIRDISLKNVEKKSYTLKLPKN